MAVSAIFNIGDFNSYIEDTIEDHFNLRSNPCEGGEVDAGACPQGKPEDDQGQGN